MSSDKSKVQQAEICDHDSLLGLAVDTYIFGFASVEMFRTMYQLAGSQGLKNSYLFNQFVHSRRRATADDDWLAAPNSEILYSNAWLDLSEEPLLLHIPDMGDRYYVLQFLDFFADAFAYVGTRSFGNRARYLVIAGPKWSGSVPCGATVLKSPTNFAWIFGRISIQGDCDLGTVHNLQDQFTLRPMVGSGKPAPSAEPWPPFRTTDELDFFANLDQVLRRNAPPKEAAELISRLPQLGMLRSDPFEPNAADGSVRNILTQAVTAGNDQIVQRESQFEEFCPGWIWEGLWAGRPGRDHLSRAASAKAGLGILSPEEAIYPFAYVDDRDDPLDGSRSYRLTVARDKLQEAKYSWSFTVYKLPHYQLVKNPIDRYSWGSASGGVGTGHNGYVQLILQADQPSDPTNWLPAPRTGNFVVALRMFGPSEGLLQGNHRLPPVTRS